MDSFLGALSLSAQSSCSFIGQDPPRHSLARLSSSLFFSPSLSLPHLPGETHPVLVSLIPTVQQPTSERQRCQRFPSLPLHFSSATRIRSDSHTALVLFPKNPIFWADRRAPYHAGCSNQPYQARRLSHLRSQHTVRSRHEELLRSTTFEAEIQLVIECAVVRGKKKPLQISGRQPRHDRGRRTYPIAGDLHSS